MRYAVLLVAVLTLAGCERPRPAPTPPTDDTPKQYVPPPKIHPAPKPADAPLTEDETKALIARREVDRAMDKARAYYDRRKAEEDTKVEGVLAELGDRDRSRAGELMRRIRRDPNHIHPNVDELKELGINGWAAVYGGGFAVEDRAYKTFLHAIWNSLEPRFQNDEYVRTTLLVWHLIDPAVRKELGLAAAGAKHKATLSPAAKKAVSDFGAAKWLKE